MFGGIRQAAAPGTKFLSMIACLFVFHASVFFRLHFSINKTVETITEVKRKINKK